MNYRGINKQAFILKLVFFSILLMALVGKMIAGEINLSFGEVAQSADLIFVGTVESQKSRFNEQQTLILTEVLFSDIVIINSTDRATQSRSSDIILQHAGGCVDDLYCGVNIAPVFRSGHRYLLFVSDDGKTYVNPVVGGSQGFFEVMSDVQSGEEFVLTAGRKVICGAGTQGLIKGKSRVAYFQAGLPVYELNRVASHNKFFNPPPKANHFSDSASISLTEVDSGDQDRKSQPLSLVDFIDYIKNVALTVKIKKKILKGQR